MLELFRNNHLSNSILLIPYIFLLRLKFFFAPWSYVPKETDTPLAQWFFGILEGSHWVSFFLTVILVFIIAMITNVLVMKYRVSRDQSLFPAMMFVLVSSISIDMIMISPVLITILLLGFALINLVGIYKKPEVSGKMLNAGFLLAISQLFYSSSIVFLLLGLAAIIILKSPRLREYFQYLAGWIAVYFLLTTILYWKGNLSLISSYSDFSLRFKSIFEFENHLAISASISLIIWIVSVILSYNVFTQKKNLQAVKNLSIIYWVFLCGFLSLFFSGPISGSHFYMIAIPSAVFGSLYLENLKRQYLAEFLHLFIIAVIFFFHFM